MGDGEESRVKSLLRDVARKVRRGRQSVRPAVRIAVKDRGAAVTYARFSASIRRDLGADAANAYAALIEQAAKRDGDVARSLATRLYRELYRVGAARRRSYIELMHEVVARHLPVAPLVADVAAELLEELEPDAVRDFVTKGAETYATNPEAGESFLRRRSKAGLQHAVASRPGMGLDELRSVLTLYARAHCGKDIGIRPLAANQRAYATHEALYLPERVAAFEDGRDFLVYRITTAMCAGYIEFGTLELSLDRIEGPWVPRRDDQEDEVDRLARSFGRPRLARDLFQIVEDRRVEGHVRSEYPGIARDMDVLRRQMNARPDIRFRSPAEQLVELVVRWCWQLPTEESLPEPVVEVFDALVPMLEEKTGAGSSVADSAVLTALLYAAIGAVEAIAATDSRERQPPTAPGEDGGSTEDAVDQQPEDASSVSSDEAQATPQYGGIDMPPSTTRIRAGVPDDGGDEEGSDGGGEATTAAAVSAPLQEEDSTRRARTDGMGGRDLGDAIGAPIIYPEWDAAIGDFKPNWVRVQEHRVHVLGSAFVHATRQRHRGLIRRLRRSFEAMRPEEVRRRRRLVEGDELDLDAVIEARIARRAGGSPPERLYARRERAVRDVAVAFLLDLSSSTSEVVTLDGQRIIDIEKAALVCIAEALDAIDDPFAVYGFSGYGREHVAFYVAKDFDEPLDDRVRDRLGGLSCKMENRDGAAIRHCTRKLLERPAKVHLMLMLSDGRPLDCGCDHYYDRYAQDDTRVALQEARRAGVHPFCLTVDPRGEDYLASMYGTGNYTIVDRVEALPTRLPALYRRLTR